MKKFKFRYKRILEVRIIVENDFKNKLGQINTIINDEEINLKNIINQFKELNSSTEEIMKKGALAGQLQSMSSDKTYFENKISKIKNKIKVLENQRIEIQKELIEANKNRKVMEKLREKEYAEYLKKEAKEEVALIDQIVTYNSTKKGGE